MSEIQEAAAPAVETAVVESTPAPATPDDTMAAIFDKHHPNERVNRGDGGKFTSKNPETQAEGAETAEPAEEINQEPVAESVETAKPSIKPRPQSWSADLDQWWAELPPERQEFLLKRETEAHQKITQLGEQARNAEKFASVVNRYRQFINGQPEQEIESLLQTKAALLQNPAGSIQWLAQHFGVDLSQFAQAQNGDTQPENGQVRSLMQEVAQLRRQLGETHSRITAREQAEQETRVKSLDDLVEDFKKGKDYWNDIEPSVAEQIIAIRERNPGKDPKEVLQEAHERAVKLNDAISARLNAAKLKEEADKKAAAEKKKADEAKRLASLNAKSSSGSTPRPAKNIDAELEEIYDRVASRG